MKTLPVATYDPAEISMVWSGVVIEGIAPDTFIEVARSNDMWEKVAGCDGIIARSKKNDKSGTVTVTLMHTSPSNDVFSASAIADELSNSGIGTFALRDNLGRTVAFALEAWVNKPADISFGSTVGTRQWVLSTGDMDITVGGAAA